MKPLARFHLFLTAAVLVSCTSSKSGLRSAALSGVSVPDLEHAEFSATHEHQLKNRLIREYSGSAQGTDLQVSRIESMDAETAKRILDSKRFQVENLSAEKISPYPGDITYRIKCSADFTPVITQLHEAGMSGLRIEAAANSRRSLGVCDDSEFAYRAVLLYMYCEKEKLLLQIESYFPRGKNKTEWMKQAGCKT